MLHKKKFAGPAVALLALAGAFAARPGRTESLEVYGRLPGLEEVALSPDGSRLAFVRNIGNDRLLGILSFAEHKELVDMTTFRAEPPGELYDKLPPLLETRRITYAAADGLEIPAYLTLPRGKPARNLPLIVLPHGGPAARDTADFDWWPQALADQGYLVLQPNYRGAPLTQKHLTAGFGEWGRKMQTDLSDGVRYLAKEGLADPARVCIVGASYGGYAAFAGVTLDPVVYRCAVSVAGISDLKRMLQWESEEGDRGQHYWDRFMGVTGPSDPLLERISPIKHLAAVDVPILLIDGRDDTVVPFEQSQVMFDAMKHAKKQVEMVTLKNEDHWLSRGETCLQMLQSTVAFVRAHNPPE